jgi:aminoglycoside phosphotransferase family enzyme
MTKESVLNQKQIVEALLRPDAYEEETGQIELRQTHISFIFLTRNFAYKVKKAVDFGFLDFTTLEKRHFFCEKELALNKRLCGDMYIDVVPINKSDAVRINGEGKTIEYAVKMKRIAEEKIMTKLLEEGKVDKDVIDRIAKIIAKFHLNAENNERVDEFGSFSVIERNWRENFEQTQEFINKTISPRDYQLIHEKVNSFMKENYTFLEKRVIDKRIRECHGDIHSGNIFIDGNVYIFDAIEFNERFRYSDCAADIAFLAMDLDFKNRKDLSAYLIEKYIQYSLDDNLEKVLSFYKCYRAYVRGKVIGFKLNDPNVDDEIKSETKKEAKAYFNLAAQYARNL